MADSSYTRDKLVSFFTKLEEKASLAGDWSEVDQWRDISHWLEKNVCDVYERELNNFDREGVLKSDFESLEDEVASLERDLEKANQRIANLLIENERLEYELDEVCKDYVR